MWQTRTRYDADLQARNQLRHGSGGLQLFNLDCCDKSLKAFPANIPGAQSLIAKSMSRPRRSTVEPQKDNRAQSAILIFWTTLTGADVTYNRTKVKRAETCFFRSIFRSGQ